jgi:hypothetical protein
VAQLVACSQAKRVVCPCGRSKSLYLLLGKQRIMPFSLQAHYQVKELGKSYTCPAKTVMQCVSKNAMRIECQEDATYIR